MKYEMSGDILMQYVIILSTIAITVEQTLKTDTLSITSCQGNDQYLMWNFTKGVYERAKELQWFFNETTLICLDSKTDGFHVTDLYTSRVENKGSMGLLLKNVTLNDTGEYTLYMKLDEEMVSNIPGILLTVEGQIEDHCRPILKTHSKSNISCSTSCKRLTLSMEWSFNGTGNPVGLGSFFVLNSSWTNERLSCCLRCLECNYRLCSLNHVSFVDDLQHERNQSEMCPPAKVTNCECIETEMLLALTNMILLVIILTGLVVFLKRRHTKRQIKTKKKLAEKTNEECKLIQEKGTHIGTVNEESDLDEEYNGNLQQVVVNAATTTDSNLSDQYKKNLQEVVYPVATTKDSILAEQYNGNLQQVVNTATTPKDSNLNEQDMENQHQVDNIITTTTARPLLDSNQQVKSTKINIMAPDSRKNVPYYRAQYTVDLRASKKESRTLKNKVRIHKHSKQLPKRRKLS